MADLLSNYDWSAYLIIIEEFLLILSLLTKLLMKEDSSKKPDTSSRFALDISSLSFY